MYSLGTGAARLSTASTRFQNPIAPGADPWVVRRDGYYYWCLSERDLGVAVYRSQSLTSLGEKFMVWRAPERGPYSAQVWAPELHFLDGRWYIYVAASNGENATHRLIVLESNGTDPTKPFHFKSELYTGDDCAMRAGNCWAIDGTVLELRGQRYLLWSGWADEHDEQWLFIAPMANPWTLAARRIRICANDDYLWERVGESRQGRGLNEAPQVLLRGERVFVIYSCSGSWEPSYKLGLLELLPGGDPLDPWSWSKHSDPVLHYVSDTTCGVGHCSFTHSPDGAEDWIVFHAKVSPKHGWDRAIHAQPFSWHRDGRPNFGVVAAADESLPVPGVGARGEPEVVTRVRSLIQSVEVRKSAGEASGEPLILG
jgi:GH43 family beta-xylosidase